MKRAAFLLLIIFFFTYSFSNAQGCISGDCTNGFGVYTWSSGEKYEGFWKNGQRNGYGINYFANGAKYTGNWVNDKKNGYGNILVSSFFSV
jgi:hypothetical protein